MSTGDPQLFHGLALLYCCAYCGLTSLLLSTFTPTTLGIDRCFLLFCLWDVSLALINAGHNQALPASSHKPPSPISSPDWNFIAHPVVSSHSSSHVSESGRKPQSSSYLSAENLHSCSFSRGPHALNFPIPTEPAASALFFTSSPLFRQRYSFLS